MSDETGRRRTADSRQERLKSALRENLKRRKLQARERAEAGDRSPNHDRPADKDSAGGK